MAESVYIVVTPFFPTPTSWRGAFCYDFVRALERTHKYRVVVFAEGDGVDYEIGGITVRTFKARRLPSNLFPNLFADGNSRRFLEKAKAVGIDQGWGLDEVKVVHGHTANYAIYPLAVKAHNPKVKTLLHHHDPQSFGLNLGALKHSFVYNAWLFCAFRKLFERIDCHVFISELVRRSFLSAPDASWTIYGNYQKQMRGPKFFRCRPVRIKESLVLHNGVDTSIFSPGRKDCDPKTFTIGCVANFVDWKDQETLIRAVARIGKDLRVRKYETIRVVFVGSGPELNKCKVLANSVNESNLMPCPRFEFRSEVRHAELVTFYRSLDLFVLPSYFEGFGCVFTEAWSSGVPFITCEGQGMDDLIFDEDRNLWLFSPRDVVGLAEKIKIYIENRPVQRLRMPVDIDQIIRKMMSQNAHPDANMQQLAAGRD